MNKLTLTTICLIFLSTFAFADIPVTPFDYAIPLAILAVLGVLIIGAMAIGIAIIYLIYVKVIKKKK